MTTAQPTTEAGQLFPDPPAIAATSWVGWRKIGRPRARWQVVVQAPTEAEAFRKLLEFSHQHPEAHASLLVLPSGEKP